MRSILTATALAGALAVTPLAALAQQDAGQAGAPETQATETPEAQTPETHTGEARDFRIIDSSDDLEGLDFSELRIEPVEEVPRDHVMAIISSLDPANEEAAALREQLGEIEGFEQALSEENVEEERVVGAALEENDLVVYFLPEGETRESWAAEMPAPDSDAAAGADEPGAVDTGQQPGEPGAGAGQQQPSGDTSY